MRDMLETDMKEAPARVLAAFAVTEKQAGQRLDRFLKERIPKLSRARIQEAIGRRVAVRGRGGARPALLLRAGDVVEVREERIEEAPFPAALIPTVLFADQTLIAVDKPAFLPVHSTRRIVKNQLIRWLRDRFGEEVALAHRLDRETSGVVLSVRSSAAARVLAKAFAAGEVKKEYLAIVHGVPPERFAADLPVGKDPDSAVHIKQKAGVVDGAPSRTRFLLAEVSPDRRFALVRAFPETGRRHQIRVHLAALGFPVVGDKLYARGERHFLNYIARGASPRMTEALGASRQLLHAARLEVLHPLTGLPLALEAPLPADFLPPLGRPSRSAW